MDITLHSKDLCVQCDATKRAIKKALIKLGLVDDTIIATGGEIRSQDNDIILEVIVIDGDDAQKANDDAKADLGFLKAPIVVTDERAWFGFRPDEIKYFFTDAAEAMARGRKVTITIYQASAVPAEPSLVAV